MTRKGYPYLFGNLLHRIRCTTQPVVNSTPGNKSQSPQEQPPVTHNPMELKRRQYVTYS